MTLMRNLRKMTKGPKSLNKEGMVLQYLISSEAMLLVWLMLELMMILIH